ncbi:MAG: division/cell wall cluster transcriptional repressor MraZ [Clostridia bacterium]|nr:division/cell wall cluster transcriptional repressor MraZ [Clostridia bacterium]
MLIGTYRHSVDAKKRMRMPSKFKSELGANFVITKGNSGNLFVFSNEQFSALYEKMVSLPLFDEEAQKPIRKFLSSAFEAEEDNQGRVLLPKELVKHAGIEKNMVFVGVGNRVEIWAEEAWDKLDADDEESDFSVLAKFGV